MPLPEHAPQSRFRRILVVLDSSTHSRAMLDLLATFAEQLHAELHGLYLEDSNLTRLTEHTETTAYCLVSYGPSTSKPGMIARAVKAQVAQNRRLIEEVTRRRSIRSSFQEHPGEKLDEVLATVQDGDLIVLPKSGRGYPATLLRAINQSPAQSVLLFNPYTIFSGAVMTVYDGSPFAETAFEAACDITALNHGEIEVVMLTPRLNDVVTWRHDLSGRAHARGLTISFLHLPEMRIDQLCVRARRPQAGLIVLGVDQPLLKETDIDALFARIDCSVLIVR